ncbi:hypothetical protein [Bradyrhizobium sp. CCBAU 53421]|uniref:hypothetical protein n=1 Tax=Bradyrhizobium sp. CCBAU 53421 TaxID=1325120 RepID=UPI00188DA5F9|nr:hypothetical protein [Bradyrhizobium sp. CCBAU 53421]
MLWRLIPPVDIPANTIEIRQQRCFARLSGSADGPHFSRLNFFGRFAICARDLSTRPARSVLRRAQVLETISQEQSFDGAVAGAESLSF